MPHPWVYSRLKDGCQNSFEPIFAGIAGFPAAYLMAALCMVVFLGLYGAQLLCRRQSKAR